MLGVCNGFQALIKPGAGTLWRDCGHRRDLSHPDLQHHRAASVPAGAYPGCLQPVALADEDPAGEIYTVPISHGEGRFLASEELVRQLAERGQIATQYVDLAGNPTSDIHYNPNNSVWAIEGITSPDGRVFGKMGHSERTGPGLYRNVPGDYDMKLFRAAVEYFQ